MPNRATPRPSPATLRWQVDTKLLAELMERFSRHSPTIRSHDSIFHRFVRTELDFFAQRPRLLAVEWPPAVVDNRPWLSEYLKALDSLATNSGLDRLDRPTLSSASGRKAGHELLHRSFWQRALMAQNGSTIRASDCILMSVTAYGPEPEMSPSGSNPAVLVRLETHWNMDEETIHDARARMINAVSEQINSRTAEIAEASEAAGYTFTNTAVNSRDIDLLFWRLTEGLSYQQIATQWNVQNPTSQPINRESVRKAIQRIADRVGVTIG